MRLILLALLAVPLFGECETAFHVARGDGDALVWGETSEDMREWWAEKGKEKHPSLCYEADPAKAEYVVIWRTEKIQRTIQLPATSTTRTTGSVGRTPVAVNSTTQGTRPATQNLLTVYVEVYDREHRTVYRGERTGRWRWSKPDENALEDALEQMAGKFPNYQEGLE